MKLYRFVRFDEIFNLKQNRKLIATKSARRFGNVNTVKADRNTNGIFFSVKKQKGYYHFMMDTCLNHYLLEIEIPDNDERIIEECMGIYDDYENFDYDPDDPDRPRVYLPEVVVKEYSLNDVVRILDMNKVIKKITNHGCGYITF